MISAKYINLESHVLKQNDAKNVGTRRLVASLCSMLFLYNNEIIISVCSLLYPYWPAKLHVLRKEMVSRVIAVSLAPVKVPCVYVIHLTTRCIAAGYY